MHLYVLGGLGERIERRAAARASWPRSSRARSPSPRLRRSASSPATGGSSRRAAPTRAPAELFYALQTDLGLRWPSHPAAPSSTRRTSRRTYVYLFTWPSPVEGGALRACHGLDLPFTFGTLDAPGMEKLAGAGPAAERLSAPLRAAWIAFARSGDPSPPGLGAWPPYAGPRLATIELGARCRVLDAPFAAERALWDAALRE